MDEFSNAYTSNEVDAICKLFRFHMTDEEWKDLKGIMSTRGLSHMNLYSMQVENLQKNDITNTWKLVL
ncbi:hypothetical protein V7183_23965 [Bacillus sp. JJ1127]|uniref:hypothetical protein n=1 Tax=Bacillus sp. JJ1127 TaxID=3122952 RepID=UPI003000D29A